jgi:hypothetical protein
MTIKKVKGMALVPSKKMAEEIINCSLDEDSMKRFKIERYNKIYYVIPLKVISDLLLTEQLNHKELMRERAKQIQRISLLNEILRG